MDVARWDTPIGRVCRAELRNLTAEPGSDPPGGTHPAGVLSPGDQERTYLESAFRLSWAAAVMAGGYIAENDIGVTVTGTRRMPMGVQIVSYAARMEEDGLLIRTRKTPRSQERRLKILFPVRLPLITDAPEPGVVFRAWAEAHR